MLSLNDLRRQLQILALQGDQGNSIYLAEQAIRDFMVSVPPNNNDQRRNIGAVITTIDDMMSKDSRTTRLLEGLREFCVKMIPDHED